MTASTAQIQSILRVPIKSFQGEAIESALLGESGIFADRPLALAEKATGKVLSGKHPRVGDQILRFEARYLSEPVAGAPLPAVVAMIDGAECRTDDVGGFARKCSEVLGLEVELVRAGGSPAVYETYWPEIEGHPLSNATLDFPLSMAEAGSFADIDPLHILTTGSVRHLAGLRSESQIAAQRFRASIVIDTGDVEGFVENEWVGRTATVGEATLEFGSLTPRCVMTTRPQAGLSEDLHVLRTLNKENRHEYMGMQMPCLGIYAKVAVPGQVAVGDPIRFS